MMITKTKLSQWLGAVPPCIWDLLLGIGTLPENFSLRPWFCEAKTPLKISKSTIEKAVHSIFKEVNEEQFQALKEKFITECKRSS